MAQNMGGGGDAAGVSVVVVVVMVRRDKTQTKTRDRTGRASTTRLTGFDTDQVGEEGVEAHR